MRGARALVCALLLSLCACDAAKPSPAPAAAAAPEPTVYLNEWFELGKARESARCRVSAARSLLAESASLPYAEAHVRPDVHAVDVSLECLNAAGTAVPSRDVLPLDSSLLLVQEREARAPRPAIEGDARDHLVFEVPAPGTGFLPSARRYSVDSGASVVAREASVAQLRIQARSLALGVALRERFQDAALDRLLDALLLGLSRGGELDALALDAQASEALRELGSTFREVGARFKPARIELTRSVASASGLQLTLSLTRPRAHARLFEVARFELGLTRAADASWRVRSFDNRTEARIALRCERLEEDLVNELSQLLLARGTARSDVLLARGTARLDHSAAGTASERCNALGVLLPASCHDVDPELLTRALDVGARCRIAYREAPESKARVPDDFQITMRRGRSLRGLDRDPRYVVALFHQGQVVFHGKHWVTSKERSDGRTLPSLLAGLYEHIRRLDWFERRGGQYNPDGCVPSDDEGDVITVTASGRQRMVLSRDGCRGPFSEAELSSLRRHVELVSGISGWTEPERPDTQGSAPGIEHWAIAE
jgi:hypothetical protein